MNGVNPGNERIKRRYFEDLRDGEGVTEVTIDQTRRIIAEFEEFTGWQDFKRFRRKMAITYRNSLLAGGGRQRAHASSRATIHNKLSRLEKFFRWLRRQPGFKTAFSLDDVQCFGLSLRDQAIARQGSCEQPTPSLEQVQKAIRAMPASTDVELRNRALLACLLLTGIRIEALTTLKLKHLRADQLGINQDAREVKTKGRRSFPTFFIPVGDDIFEMFLDYVRHLRSELGWADEDPLFPRTRQSVGDDHMFRVVGLERAHWRDTGAARRVCKRAFESAQLPPYTPHAVRRTVIRIGQERCQTAEQYKAWSQNVGHSDVLTSFRSYGGVALPRQAEIIAGLRDIKPDLPPLESLVERLVAKHLSSKTGFADDLKGEGR